MSNELYPFEALTIQGGATDSIAAMTRKKAAKTDIYEGKNQFIAVILKPLTEGTGFTQEEVAGQVGTEAPDNSAGTHGKIYGFKIRIISANSPHAFLPEPCYDTTNTAINGMIQDMHTTALSREGTYANGDEVYVQLEKTDFSYNLDSCWIIGPTNSNQGTYSSNLDCLTVKDAFGGKTIDGAVVVPSGAPCADTTPATSDWARITLIDVLRKKSTDVLPLDGGSIGVAHYASSGLEKLYKGMGDTITKKYFGDRTVNDLITFSKGKNWCKGTTPTGQNDDGTGCYSTEWWRVGMERFVQDPKSKEIQSKIWLAKTGNAAKKVAEGHGWVTSRQFAIAAGITNSLGPTGFRVLATKAGWDSEKTLRAYVVGANQVPPAASDPKRNKKLSDQASQRRHWQRRMDRINNYFPCKSLTGASSNV